jgi:mercuric ion binding protein
MQDWESMNTIRQAVIILTFLILPLVADAEPNIYQLKVDGLGCPFCAYGIEKKLSAIDGVEQIEVDLKKGQVIVIMAEGVSLSEERARQAVTDAGFTLRAFTQRKTAEKE